MYNYKILLADDDADDRDFFRYALKRLDVDLSALTEAQNGEEVLRILEKADGQLPDIIVLDQNMPLMTGEQALQAIKADDRFRHIPVALYSTSNFANQKQKFLDMGAFTVAAKPISLEDYKGMVEGILSQVGT